MALHDGGHLELKKMHKGDFWGLFGIRLGRCPCIIPEKISFLQFYSRFNPNALALYNNHNAKTNRRYWNKCLNWCFLALRILLTHHLRFIWVTSYLILLKRSIATTKYLCYRKFIFTKAILNIVKCPNNSWFSICFTYWYDEGLKWAHFKYVRRARLRIYGSK